MAVDRRECCGFLRGSEISSVMKLLRKRWFRSFCAGAILNRTRRLHSCGTTSAVLLRTVRSGYAAPVRIFWKRVSLLSRLPICWKGKWGRAWSSSFNRKMGTVRRLYGNQLSLPKFTRADIGQLLAPLLEYYPKPLRGFISDRVMCCILTRQKFL